MTMNMEKTKKPMPEFARGLLGASDEDDDNEDHEVSDDNEDTPEGPSDGKRQAAREIMEAHTAGDHDAYADALSSFLDLHKAGK